MPRRSENSDNGDLVVRLASGDTPASPCGAAGFPQQEQHSRTRTRTSTIHPDAGICPCVLVSYGGRAAGRPLEVVDLVVDPGAGGQGSSDGLGVARQGAAEGDALLGDGGGHVEAPH